ncbi:MAG: UDP-N-acetylmuramate dehydrogenase [Eubacteriales bacterium]|nr:UDP-N-acetylmuramate dehydrogenase [Eubacteriales bacterium]
MNQTLIDEMTRIVGKENIRCEEPMAKHTTFQIGGPAQLMVLPSTVEEIQRVFCLCKEQNVPFFVMGNGSNLLVSDQGMDGVVMVLARNFSAYEIQGTKVTAQAGAMLATIGNAVCERELTGFEFAAGIPGTIGGAVMMNAGAYGGEMKDIIQSVQVLDGAGNILELSCNEMDFGYRHSVVEENGYLVLGATMCLQDGEKSAIRAKMKELSEARRSKQPLEYPSAGSTFKRPEGYFAGKLIMDAGLRGYQVGGAQVSEKHCGFVINRGGATAQDVMQLILDVQDKVYDAYQVTLEPEVKLVGRQ